MNDKRLRSLMAELGEVIRLSLPIIFTMISHTMMQFMDTLMIGRYGKLELAAASPGGLTFFTIGSFMLGLVGCNNTFVSQCLGQGRRHECTSYTVHTIYLGLFAQVLILPLIAAAPALFRLFGHEAAVRTLETTYFRTLAFRLAGMSAVGALSAFFQGTGRPVVPMVTGILANLLNIIGDYALIFGKLGFPEWGLFGAGVMTTAATYFEAALLLAAFLSKSNHAMYNTRRWGRFESRKLLQILRIGAAAGATFALDLASWTIFIGAVIGRLGANALAANNAAGQIMHVSFMPAVGLNVGVTALVGRYIGQNDIAGAKRRAYLGMACACAYMSLMGLVFFIFRRTLIEIFSSEQEVVSAGAIILAYAALFQFADAIGILSSGALKGAGDTRFPALAQIAIAWGFFLPLVLYVGRSNVWGLHGAWLAATIYIWVYDAVLFWRFVSERWRKINIFA